MLDPQRLRIAGSAFFVALLGTIAYGVAAAALIDYCGYLARRARAAAAGKRGRRT